MISKQLNRLCVISNCFIYKGAVYERLVGKRYKYRVMFSDDDYDYVTDKSLKQALDKFIKSI